MEKPADFTVILYRLFTAEPNIVAELKEKERWPWVSHRGRTKETTTSRKACTVHPLFKLCDLWVSFRFGSCLIWIDRCLLSLAFLFLRISLFMCVLLSVLGLLCCTWTFSSCSMWGLLSSCGAQASHYSGFSCCGGWAMSTGSAVGAWGIFLDEGSNLYLLHWQVDS